MNSVQELLSELLPEDYDPDEGLEFKPEIAEYLSEVRRTRPRGTPLTDLQ